MMNRKRVETEIYTAAAISFGSHELQPAFISQLELAISVERSLSLYRKIHFNFHLPQTGNDCWPNPRALQFLGKFAGSCQLSEWTVWQTNR